MRLFFFYFRAKLDISSKSLEEWGHFIDNQTSREVKKFSLDVIQEYMGLKEEYDILKTEMDSSNNNIPSTNYLANSNQEFSSASLPEEVQEAVYTIQVVQHQEAAPTDYMETQDPGQIFLPVPTLLEKY